MFYRKGVLNRTTRVRLRSREIDEENFVYFSSLFRSYAAYRSLSSVNRIKFELLKSAKSHYSLLLVT